MTTNGKIFMGTISASTCGGECWGNHWNKSLKQMKFQRHCTSSGESRVKTDPFINVSSNCVPPFEEPRTPTFVLWIGTSILKVIDEKKVGIEAGVVVEEKIYTVIRVGCFKPHLNLQEKLASLDQQKMVQRCFY